MLQLSACIAFLYAVGRLVKQAGFERLTDVMIVVCNQQIVAISLVNALLHESDFANNSGTRG